MTCGICCWNSLLYEDNVEKMSFPTTQKPRSDREEKPDSRRCLKRPVDLIILKDKCVAIVTLFILYGIYRLTAHNDTLNLLKERYFTCVLLSTQEMAICTVAQH